MTNLSTTSISSEPGTKEILDIDLTTKGIEEAAASANLLNEFNFDVVHTSQLKRSIKTANIMLE